MSNPAFDSIPADLRALPIWLLWKPIKKNGKVSKVPFSAHGGFGSSTNTATWAAFDEVVTGYKGGDYGGIGIGVSHDIAAIDIDDCVKDGELSELAQDVVNVMNCYTEYSPSGTGLRLFFKAPDFAYDKKRHYIKNPHNGLEVYVAGCTNRFVTVTGNVIKDAPIDDRTDEITAVLEAYMLRDGFHTVETAPSGPILTDEEIIQKASAAQNGAVFSALWRGDMTGYPSPSEADIALCNLLAFYCQGNVEQMDRLFRLSGLYRDKWDRDDYSTATLEKAVHDCKSFYTGTRPQNGVPSFYEGKVFQHHVMGEYLIAKLGVCKINDALHVYDNGVYRHGEDLLHGYMVQLVPFLSDAKRREVYKYMKVSLNTPVKSVSPPHLIPFKSWIYDISNNRFLQYSPEYVFLNRFPYDYYPDAAPQPLVTDTIEQIADRNPEVIAMLYEAIGSCFYMLNSFRGAVMLYGKNGNNGKSTLLNMLAQLFGPENTSFLSLQDLAERFRLVGVYGKAVNIGDDIPSTYLPESSTIRKLITGEVVTAEKKGQDAFHFRSFAKMFFAMNGLPRVGEKTSAYYGRLLPIPLQHDFASEGTRNASLKDRVWTQPEMEWLTRLAVDGLKRLMWQGDFTRPAIVKELLLEYERDNNPVIEFLEEYGDVEGKPTQFVYDEYRMWSYQAGHKNPMTRQNFSEMVISITGLHSESTRSHHLGGKTGRCFVKKDPTSRERA